jgi:GNAT superfamily N-acetyltransferase
VLIHREATLQDVELLATMNRQLIEDEQHPRNIHMTMAQLQERMRGFLADDYHATVFERGGRTIAYALYRDRGDSIYLRQFFVARDCRREGLGRKAMSILREQIWPADRRLTVEVLVSNHTGLCFWRAVGYRDYCIELEILPGEGPSTGRS